MARKTALVTGASQGIGAATALALARAGYDVAVSSTQRDKLAPLTAELQSAGARALAVELDVRQEASIAAAMRTVVSELGGVHLLVNNAGVPLRRMVVDITRAEWDEVIAVNLTGTFFMTQQMGRHLIAAGQPGCIVNIASTHALVGMAERSSYGIAKAGMLQMTRMLAIEWADHGIRVNAVAPGRIETVSRAGSMGDPAYRASMTSRIPLKRFGTAEEVAAAVCYLASPEGAYITGQTLVLDGGLTAY